VKLVQKKFAKKLFVFLLLAGGIFFARFLLAADFGTEAVNNGLGGTLAEGDPRTIAGRIINWSLGFLGVIAIGIILYAGFMWMTSNGEEDKIRKAKQTLKNGVIGLAIILSSWAIATFILMQLGGTINPVGGCVENQIQSCQCDGQMVCIDGVWGACTGNNPANCITPPTSCDASPDLGCQPYDNCIIGYFCDNSCLCQTQGGPGDSCDTDLNNTQCDPDDNRCSEYLTCNPATCLCAGPPVITGVSPVGGFCNSNFDQPCLQDEDCGNADTCNLDAPNGATNNFVTIFGKSFGEYSATTSQVVFLGVDDPRIAGLPATINPLCINSWRDDQIVVAVSPGVQSGPIKVINADSLSDVTNNNFGPSISDFTANHINRPGLCYLDPSQGLLSAEVSYQGINLYTGKAYFGNYQNNVSGLDSNFTIPSGLSGTSTTPNIQAGTSGSFVERMMAGFPQKSNYLKFVKEKEAGAGPFIMSFTPVEGNTGQYVTIRGAGFGGARGNNQVYFAVGNNKTEASYLFPAICANSVWKDKQIIVKVPEGLVNDNYQIQITLGTSTITTENLNPNTFRFDNTLSLKTSSCRINPEQGPIDTPVTLWGEYFGIVGNNGIIRFNYNKDANGTIAKENDADIITAAVPLEAVTGPVKVIKNNEWGNELNFTVGECTKNDECNNQICCPVNTYKKGRCVASINECFIDIPTSVFEWGFSTSFDATTTPTFDSCLGLSRYLGTCYQGNMCPNSPGACSAPSTSYQKTVGICDVTCQGVDGCSPSTCTYNDSIDKCVKSGSCSLPESVTYIILGNSYTTEKTCNSAGRWEIVSPGSCPSGWTRTPGNRCIENNTSCDLCSSGLNCELVNSTGRCVSSKLCADAGAKCIDNPVVTEADKCIVDVTPSCECCCRIGQDAQDCCAPLTCEGKCGSDIIDNSNTYGSCSGCAAVGTTAAEHDAACNCAGHTSQYCDISAANPAGICVDCSRITSQENCGDHSSVCCFDSNKTATTTDDACQGLNGGTVVDTNPASLNYGYCAYFNCQALPADPLICASSTPLKIGFFNDVDNCIHDCPEGIGSDPCRVFDNNQASCMNETACCYDATTLHCLSGDKIEGGTNNGYCAYYTCQTPPANPLLCDPTPTTTPIFSSTSSCALFCGNPPGGAGLGCIDYNATSSCNFGLCNFPGFACLKDTGAGGVFPDCGTCCCQVGNTPDSCVSPSTPNLHCQADRGSCTGSGRGLCCGCTNDNDCGSINTTGCGIDGCCQARPGVEETSPTSSAINVCRNASLKVVFNQNMDLTSFGNNFLLFEERVYGNGVCPAGTFLTDARTIDDLMRPNQKNIFARLWQTINLKFGRLFGRVNDQALATAPDPAKLYCAIPGMVSAEETGLRTNLIFTPSRVLSPSTKYYAVVKGDELLNSQTGVLSFSKIGMNERGLDEGNGTFIPSDQVKFNTKAYLNSYSFQFTTLSDQGVNAGICAIDHVVNSPASYLFKTTKNDLDEKDNDLTNRTFDTAPDRDKVFTAGAYSANNQLLHPVTGYAWNWVWSIDNTSIAQILNVTPNLPEQRKLVASLPDITDGQTKINATVNMDNFRPAAACGANCNAYFTGDGETKASDIFVFLCDNPWPAVTATGEWFPWNDLANNCSVNPVNCENYNYKFYYCRDAGAAGTLDDLPAIASSPVVRGQGSNLLCSSDKTPCSGEGSPCGNDQNGDGALDGVCYWNVLKESYFFREAILPSGELIDAADTGQSGEVKLDWRSPSNEVGSYKIYYLKSGKGAMYTKEVTVAGAPCSPSGSNYICTHKITGLTNGQPYVFKLSVISNNRTESALSNEKTATPTNQTRPSKPSTPTVEISTTTVKFSWTPNPAPEGVLFYRLYRGINPGLYGESFDSANQATSLTFNRNQFTPTLNYFALSAFSISNIESDKSDELMIDLH